MNKLQKALSLNAIFSGISGIGLILFHKSISNLFNIDQSNIFWIVGIGLAFFALTILLEVKKQRHLGVIWIIIQDYIWVIGSAVLLILQPFNISNTGNNTIAIVALIVFVMAINQSTALAQSKNTNEKGRKQMVFKRTVKANKSDVWKVISDVANYHQVAPNIDEVTIVSGKDKGMVRSCSHGKDSWTETCSVWQEEKTYSFIVNTSAPDYPYPLSFMQGTWNVVEIDTNQTEIEMIFEFTYKKKILNLMHPIMKMKFNKISNELLDNWQKLLEK
jgi:ribosome-associated toxin RatA of RatAB toxin-antitoxin module